MALRGTRPFVAAGGLLAAGVAELTALWGLLGATLLLGGAAAVLPAGRRLATPFLACTALAIVWLAARWPP